MSADDWVECPFCSNPMLDEIEKVKKQLDDAYTKVTASEYDKLKSETNMKVAELQREIGNHAFLRLDSVHDYEFNDDGDLVLHIHADCEHCGRRWEGPTIIKPRRR